MIRLLIPLTIDDSPPSLVAALHELNGTSMGTSWQVKWVQEGMQTSRQAANPDLIGRAIEDELNLVVDQMSTWKNDSVLSLINHAEAGTWTAIPAQLREVLQACMWLAHTTDGAFNHAAGRLVNLWGFGPSSRYTDCGFCPPNADQVSQAMNCVNWKALLLNAQEQMLFQPGGIHLDFSAIAKGYAVDRVAEKMLSLGFKNSMVEIGGEFRGHGVRPGGLPWWVDLESVPAENGALFLPLNRLALHGLAVATSGDYRRVYFQDGQRRCHSIDPRSGQPIHNAVACASVVHKSCMWADGWSTALTILGVEKGIELADQHGVAALVVERLPDGGLKESMTLAMKALMQ